ncbi:MAG: hypothetical protein AB7O39_11715 [Flavobacteriaceae bacterium]
MTDLDTDGLLGFDQMADFAAAGVKDAGRLMSRIGGGELPGPSDLDTDGLLGFDQLRDVSTDADLTTSARLLTKIGPEIPPA